MSNQPLHRYPPEPSARSAFYGWHADNGHAPEWTAGGGVECTSCGESFPGAEPEGEADAEPEPEAS